MFIRAKKGLQVLTHDGKQVDPAKVDWKKYAKAKFPYLLRQPPGPDNALGRVKFMFPNDHLVYLHDTPNKPLFEKAARAFSSGCVRVENPMELAERLLANTPGWDRARIDQVVASKKTTRVSLKEPLPIYLVYLTALVDENGNVNFRPDVYERDQSVLDALAGEFQLRTDVAEALDDKEAEAKKD